VKVTVAFIGIAVARLGDSQRFFVDFFTFFCICGYRKTTMDGAQIVWICHVIHTHTHTNAQLSHTWAAI